MTICEGTQPSRNKVNPVDMIVRNWSISRFLELKVDSVKAQAMVPVDQMATLLEYITTLPSFCITSLGFIHG